MPEIGFFVEGIAPLAHTMTPTLTLRLRVVNGTPEPVHAMLVRCQVQIEPARRGYSAVEQGRLAELFSIPSRWAETLRPWQWQQVTAMVSGFTGTTVSEVPLPCSYDFSLAATQYFEALEGGEIPLRLLFSGTVFYQGEAGVEAAPIPWELEASSRLPAKAWRDCIAAHYPDCAWLRLRREVWSRLQQRRADGGHASCEQTLEKLLA